MNEPETVGHLLHPNTPTLQLRPLSPPPFISTKEITYQTASSSRPTTQGSNMINRQCESHTPPTMMPQNFIPSAMRPEIPRLFRCRQCQSTRHQKHDCPQYQCLKCYKRKPGHYTHECPTSDNGNSRENPIDVKEYTQSISIDSDEYNHNYDPNGNLDGER